MIMMMIIIIIIRVFLWKQKKDIEMSTKLNFEGNIKIKTNALETTKYFKNTDNHGQKL